MGSYKKKLSIVLLLFLLINFCVCSSVRGATAITEDYTYTIDIVNQAKNEQEFLANVFFYYFNKASVTDTQKQELKTLIENNFVYFYGFSNSASNNNFIMCFYPKNTNFYQLSITQGSTYTGETQYINDPYYMYNVSGYYINCVKRYVTSLGTPTYGSIADSNNRIPSILIGYTPVAVSNFASDIPYNANIWSMMLNAIDNNTSATEDTTQAVNNLRNDFNEEESDSDYSFPTDNPTQDTAEASIDGVFTLFYDKINAWSSAQMQIPIPFTGKYFNIPPNLTQNIINGFPAGNVISRLLGLIWYYLLGVYIIKDVQKYIDGLQTGEILTKTDTNIKTEML